MRFIFFILLNLVFLTAFAAPEKSADKVNFLALGDIHFDPFVSCGLAKPCPLIEKLRAAPAREWSSLLRQYDLSSQQYGEDSNYTLLVSSLAAAKHAAKANEAKFVLLMGDLLGHSYRQFYSAYSSDTKLNEYADFVKKTLEFINLEVAKAFPDIDVYSVPGNNDSYHDDYISVPGGAFFADTARIWSGLIKNSNNRASMRSQATSVGYYAVDLPQPTNVRLIVLNTNIFSYKARRVSRAANEELDWLHQQLESAKRSHKRVFIAMHIPEGIEVSRSPRIQLFRLLELWRLKYTQRFNDDLEAYAEQISGVFAGHLHSDWFHILVVDKEEVPVIGVPSLSPIFGNNPGFKVFTYSTANKELDDFVTYFYPLNSKRAWGMGYDFNQITRPDCHPCPSIASMDSLQSGGSVAHFYKLFYSVNVNSKPIATQWPPYYWCAIHKTKMIDDRICVE